MKIDWPLVVEVVKALAWPVFAAFALYLLRRPLIELVAQIARRAKKVSVFEVSVELATLPELQPSWSEGSIDPRRLSSAQIFDSYLTNLFQELAKPAQAEYAIVDLKSGKAWLTSRLFVFALILGEVTGLRAFVFLESAAGVRRRFLGVATPANIRRALGRRYPWLEEAFARALIINYPSQAVPPPQFVSQFCNKPSPLAPGSAKGFAKNFVEGLQRTSDPPTDEINSYLDIGDQATKTLERTQWIDGELLEQDLAGFLENSWVEESPDIPRITVSESVARRSTSFVALVDSDRRFISLVDRYALLSEMSISKNSGSKNSLKNNVD